MAAAGPLPRDSRHSCFAANRFLLGPKPLQNEVSEDKRRQKPIVFYNLIIQDALYIWQDEYPAFYIWYATGFAI